MSAYDRPRPRRHKPASAHENGPWRDDALGFRRDLGGFVSHPGLCLQQRRGRGRPLHRRGRGLSVQPFRQSDRRHVRAAHGPARRRRSRARDRDRHGGGDRGADGAGAGRRPCGRRAAIVRLLPLYRHRPSAAFRRRNRPWSTASTSTHGRRRCGPTPKPPFWKARPIPPSACSTSRRSQTIVHSVGATLVVDNVFATPLMQKPLELGADCVVYSATKHIDGQGRCLGGVMLGSKDVHREPDPQFHPPDRAVAVALQRLGAAERAGDPAAARRPSAGQRRENRGFPGRRGENRARLLSRPRGPSAT